MNKFVFDSYNKRVSALNERKARRAPHTPNITPLLPTIHIFLYSFRFFLCHIIIPN